MIITLCGSTRFMTAFNDWNAILTMAGHTVYSVATLMTQKDQLKWPEKKRRLDLVHLDKISHSEAVVILNQDGYIGDSTIREIEWALMQRKDVYWLNNNPNNTILGPSVFTIQNLFTQTSISNMLEAKSYLL